MKFIVDANILFSALIKDSITAELLFHKDFRLYTAEFLIDEFLKHRSLILEKTLRTEAGFVGIMYALKDIITVIPEEDYSAIIKEAEKISPDKEDTMYFALALKLKCPIWSNDKKLKEQKLVKVYTTEEIKRKTEEVV
jgi:predicted nucleic acid-binding protein